MPLLPLSPIQSIHLDLLKEKNISLDVKREDLIGGGISGNKYRKLKYNIEHLMNSDSSGIITFGGAFSNHIHATAVAGKKSNLNTIGIIRGEIDPKNPTLLSARKNGMKLIPISRSSYRLKDESPEFQEIKENHPNYILIPEGGTNQLALKGVAELLGEIEHISEYDYLAVAAGTGGTASGIYKNLDPSIKLLVFSALKGDFLIKDILAMSGKSESHLEFFDDYSFGGYARTNDALIAFINEFYTATHIPLDHVYNGKLVFGLFDLIKQDYFRPDSKILWIHTGGLQGIQGYNYRNAKKPQIIVD